jgi:hypothetical protein
MPSAIAAALSITLAVCSPFVTAQTPAHDPREGQVDRVISLTKALVKGVEQCFNPSHTKGNTAAKNRLIKLEKTALSAKSSLTGGDAPKLAQTAAELEAQCQAFFEKAPLAARFHCDTQRRCMELGFEGHPNYPHCQPVNGNKHANIQCWRDIILEDCTVRRHASKASGFEPPKLTGDSRSPVSATARFTVARAGQKGNPGFEATWKLANIG